MRSAKWLLIESGLIIDITTGPFGGRIFAEPIKMLGHPGIQIISLTDIKRKILHALKDVHKEFFRYHERRLSPDSSRENLDTL